MTASEPVRVNTSPSVMAVATTSRVPTVPVPKSILRVETSVVVTLIFPPSAVLTRSALRPVIAKLPAPLMLRSTPSAKAAVLTVAVLPMVSEMVVAPAPVVMATLSMAFTMITPEELAALRSATRLSTVIAPLPARVIVSPSAKVPLLTVKEPDAALFVRVVLTAGIESLSRVRATVPVAVLVRFPSRLVMVKLPAPLVLSSDPSARASALIVTVSPAVVAVTVVTPEPVMTVIVCGTKGEVVLTPVVIFTVPLLVIPPNV